MKKSAFDLSNKHIVITGASSGIGRQTAITLSESGAILTLIARRGDKLLETIELLENKTIHNYYSIDITQYELLEEVIQKVFEKSGSVWGMVHCAGIEMVKPLASLKVKNYEEVFAVNVFAGFELAKILSKKKYCNPEGGSFVFLSSIVSIVGESTKVAYSSSKGAIVSGVKSMALELASKKIRVNSISPAVIQTEMSLSWINNLTLEAKLEMHKQHPLGLGNENDISNATVFLLAESGRWITGTNLIIDGGYSL